MQEFESMARWNMLADILREHGYRLWQWQYDASSPEGFHARFTKSGRPDVQIITRSAEVQAAIVGYKPAP